MPRLPLPPSPLDDQAPKLLQAAMTTLLARWPTLDSSCWTLCTPTRKEESPDHSWKSTKRALSALLPRPLAMPPPRAVINFYLRLQHCEEWDRLCNLLELTALISAQSDNVAQGLGGICLSLQRRGHTFRERTGAGCQ